MLPVRAAQKGEGKEEKRGGHTKHFTISEAREKEQNNRFFCICKQVYTMGSNNVWQPCSQVMIAGQQVKVLHCQKVLLFTY